MAVKLNLCRLDRMIRGVISVAAIGGGFLLGDFFGDVLIQAFIIIFGILNLISFLVGWCPVYSLANISTCKEN